MMTTYQVDYLVPEELNGAHVAERKLENCHVVQRLSPPIGWLIEPTLECA